MAFSASSGRSGTAELFGSTGGSRRTSSDPSGEPAAPLFGDRPAMGTRGRTSTMSTVDVGCGLAMPAAGCGSTVFSMRVFSAATETACGRFAGAISRDGKESGLAVSSRHDCLRRRRRDCRLGASGTRLPVNGSPDLGIAGDIDPDRACNEQQRCQGSRKLGHDLHLGGQQWENSLNVARKPYTTANQ